MGWVDRKLIHTGVAGVAALAGLAIAGSAMAGTHLDHCKIRRPSLWAFA